MYQYNACVKRIVDGDTFDAEVDLGFHNWTKQRFRLNAYSAPEVRGVEKNIGIIAKAKLVELLPIDGFIIITSTKTEKFGRWLADVKLENGRLLTELLIALGYGLPWDGKGKKPTFNPAKYPIKSRNTNRK
jgi:endonuclease YncB( thermonuclease family)